MFFRSYFIDIYENSSFLTVISSENQWKYDQLEQKVAYTILLVFHDINSAYPLMILETFVRFQ